MTLDVGFWVVGMIVALPVVRWWAHDTARIPGPVWFWTGHHRTVWRRTVAAGWLVSGWPAIVVVMVWARSQERQELLQEAGDFYARHGGREDSTS